MSFLRIPVASLLILLFAGLALGQVIDKPDPNLELTKWNGSDCIKGELLVQFKEGISVNLRNQVHDHVGTSVREVIAEGLDRIDLKETSMKTALQRYNNHPDVEYAEPNYVRWPHHVPNDPYWGNQWGPKFIDCDHAWDLYKGNSNDLVAIIDTGADLDHPDLNDHYAGGYDYFSGDPIPDDPDGHGSHCSGVAAAETNNFTGVASISYNCHFLAYRAGSWYLPDSAIVSSINAARNAGALAISMSFSGPSPSTSIKNALTNAYNAGVVNVAAAGNSGGTAKEYPAAHSNVIGVASCNQSGGRSGFSTWGQWVSVAAPGENILSCWKNKQYAYADGTSMACPHVAGAAVFLYSKLGGTRTKANADIVRSAIEDSCTMKSYVEFGVINVDKALDQLPGGDPPTLSNVAPSQVQAFQGGTITLTGTNFASATQVNSGGKVITNFNIVNATTITYTAPTATSLGLTPVTVTNPAGTSNSKNFTYIETSPPKMYCPGFTGGGDTFKWEFGAAVGDSWLLFLSTDNTTFNYQGYNILLYYFILTQGTLNAAGTGDFQLQIPTGLQGLTFYSQIITVNPQGSFSGATTYRSTLIIS